MKTEPIVFERTYDAPVSTIWEAITDKDKMKQWYFDLKEFRPEVGFEFQFYGENEGRKFLHFCKITEIVIGKKLKHSWRYDGYEGISFVTFELFEEGNNTKVRLTHKGIESFPVTPHKDFAKENFAQGWAYIIGTSLKEYLEKHQMLL